MVFGIVLAAVLIVLDQLVKRWAVVVLMPQGVLQAVPGVFEFKYIENDGAAFSLLAGRQEFLIVFTTIALLVVAFILLFRRPKEKLEAFSLLIIFSGGVGNLIDRIAQGYVVDYINLLFMNFAVFNLADIYVSIGFVLLLFSVIRAEVREKKAKSEAESLDQNDKDDETDENDANETKSGDCLEIEEASHDAED